MSTIKCPACWNEIPAESNICTHCGFRLRDETAQKPVPDGISAGYENYRNFSPVQQLHKPTQMVKKTKANEKIIIGTAVVIILLILAVGLGGNIGKKNKSNGYEYNWGNSSAGTSNYSYAVTTGPEGAVNKAKSYLNSSAFSYTGLIEQLEYEGFSTSEATYGADHCGADWKEQALRKAKSYLNSSAFSESGLQEQLEYEGFTYEQAAYGVANCGANWKEQAVKKAASYLRSHSSWTRSELIDQLEYEGFTYEQASYGASQNGL